MASTNIKKLVESIKLYVDEQFGKLSNDREKFANKSDISKVGFSGKYEDLINRPTIPSIQGLATEEYVDGKKINVIYDTQTGNLIFENAECNEK